jgi:hypothetical protein
MLTDRVRKLKHCNKVTLGSGELFQEVRHGVSRREFRQLVREMRAEVKRQRRENMPRIIWTVPGSVWAMDDTQRRGLPVRAPVCINQVRDLSSRKGLSATVTERLLPEGRVAEMLEERFGCQGAPLVIKLDNGGNLNGSPVREVCDRFDVLILNSPAHYPQYNGLIEWCQRELKSHMAWVLQGIDPDLPILEKAALFSMDRLNQWPRPCLNRQAADAVFETRHAAMSRYTQAKRKEIREQITMMAMHIIAQKRPSDPLTEQAAWRIAVETWLRRNGLITVSVNRKCYPIQKPSRSHR